MPEASHDGRHANAVYCSRYNNDMRYTSLQTVTLLRQ
jgi:hypothetical protein